MQRNLGYLITLLLLALASACTEIPPEINPIGGGGGPVDTSSVGQQERQVLIEEFTGVRCVNCPAGAAAIEQLKVIHGRRLVVLSIHAGFFSKDYPESLYDFRTDDGNSLLSYLGEPLGYPTAVVNRRQFDGEPDLQSGQAQWPGFVAQELQLPPSVYLRIDRTFDPVSRALAVNVSLRVAEDVTEEDIRLSVAIAEDGIRDVQLTPAGKQADYIHNHVLRDLLTNADGNPLPSPLLAGQVIGRSFSLSLPPDWAVENCHLAAFVHLGGERKDVLQAHEITIID